MTASLPVPNDIDPEEPDRHESAAVVSSLPSSPKAPAGKRPPARKTPRKKPAAQAAAAAAADSATKSPPKPRSSTASAKPKAAQRDEATETPEPIETPEPTASAESAESTESSDTTEPSGTSEPSGPDAGAAIDPGPPPPLPSDLDVPPPSGVGVDIVIPPKPPLPEDHAASAVPAVDEVEEVAEVEAEPEPHAVPAPVPQPEPAVDVVPEVLTAPAVEGDVLVLRGVSKRFGDTLAVDGIDLTVPAGTFYGLVGPNGAGKTTTLSMIAGLLEPDRGSIRVGGVNAAADSVGAKRLMGVLPDRLRTFDRLTGRQLLYYYGVLRGLSPAVVESRTADLARAFDLTDALGRAVSDYSAGMAKKVMLAGALIHSPRVLVLDEPFEAVDPVSSAIILDILSTYVSHGGTVILSSHGMELVERVCSRVAVIVAGQVLAEGTIDEVRGELSLEQRFIELAGGLSDVEGLEWLHTFSD